MSSSRFNKRKIVVTGGSGFIGSAYIAHILNQDNVAVLNIDKVQKSLFDMISFSQDRYLYSHGDISNLSIVDSAIKSFKPDAIVHFAAETHVDTSIDDPDIFLKSNVIGTYNLLSSALKYWNKLSEDKKSAFRFHYISTDEVYGSIDDGLYKEGDGYHTASPYSASKAAGDHFIDAWNKTYGLPTFITHCTNNYGPGQGVDKLIPHMILRALSNKSLPIYGDGKNIRDWLFVEDHVDALWLALKNAKVGETYNIAGGELLTNIEVVTEICNVLDKLAPKGQSYLEKIEFVKDRPGHDFRYGLDDSKLRSEFNWSPKESFKTGIVKTVEWYLNKKELMFKNSKKNYLLERQGVLS